MPTMKYRVLGHSGVHVSELCLGTMMFGGPADEAQSRRIVDHALDAGVNFIDTADVYTDGHSEEVIGRALKETRHRWVLATKVANPTGDGPNERGLTRIHVRRAVEASLRRLQTDHVDLYYIHKLDPDTSWEQIVLTFGELIREGKIREWGISNVRAWHIPHIHHLCRAAGVPAPTALQPYYNLMNRQPEVELLPACALLRPRRGALQPDRARRAVRQVQGQPGARGRQPRRPPGQAHDGHRVASREPADRREAEGARRGARHHAGALGDRLGAQQQDGRPRPSPARAPSSSGPATSARSTTRGPPRTRRSPIAWSPPATPPPPATPTRNTPSMAASRAWVEGNSSGGMTTASSCPHDIDCVGRKQCHGDCMIEKAPPAGWVVQVAVPHRTHRRRPTSVRWIGPSLSAAPSFKYFNVAIAAPTKALEATTKHLAEHARPTTAP